MQTVIHKIDKQQRVTVNAGNYIQYLIKTYNVKNLKGDLIMITLTFIALISLLFVAGFTVFSLFSGVGALLFACIAAIVCILAGVWLLASLLAKGIFNLFKSVVFLCLMVVPIVNIIALIALVVITCRSLKES